jgi:hypothetical protein
MISPDFNTGVIMTSFRLNRIACTILVTALLLLTGCGSGSGGGGESGTDESGGKWAHWTQGQTSLRGANVHPCKLSGGEERGCLEQLTLQDIQDLQALGANLFECILSRHSK